MSPLPTKSENPTGFHKRYEITKTDGTPCDPDAIYLVLRLDGGGKHAGHIQASRIAARAYCNAVVAIPSLRKVGSDLQDLLDGFVKVVTVTSKESEQSDNHDISMRIMGKNGDNGELEYVTFYPQLPDAEALLSALLSAITHVDNPMRITVEEPVLDRKLQYVCPSDEEFEAALTKGETT